MTSSAVTGRHGAPRRGRDIAGELPEELLHVIFSELDFKSKVIAEQVCKRWGQLLKAPDGDARHWAVDYNVDFLVSSQGFAATEKGPIVEHFNATIGRWLINRAAAISLVKVSATLSSDQKGAATMNVLESQLPLLAGCLATHVNMLALEFVDGSPFASPLLSSSAFLTSLCPMVKSLNLSSLRVPITASQFAAICELASLTLLAIGAETDEYGQQEVDGAGLQEITSDISNLVNLKTLIFDGHVSVDYIPGSISCLQKLTSMTMSFSSIEEVPSGLAELAALSMLVICGHGPLRRFPPSLQGLQSLASVELSYCKLSTIPGVLSGLSTLSRLDLKENNFHSSNGWSWWPATLSRLTTLSELDLSDCKIVSLPPHISGLRQLTKLDVHGNELRSLPEQLSSLQNLRELGAELFHFPTVPISVLSSLTALTTIRLFRQRSAGGPAFHISSSLLPILHPGLVELDLRQRADWHAWDPLSLCHLEHAKAEIADRTPVPILKFLA